MPNNAKTKKPWIWRRQYVIDRPLQMGIAGYLAAGLGGVALLCAAALYVFLGGQAVPGLDPLRRFLLVANATYFILAAGILTLLTILLTHRFAGPAFVMKGAIDGMLEGDFGKRLSLRKKDYLKELAASIDLLRHTWVRHEQASRLTLERLEKALASGDVEAAKGLVKDLQDSLLSDPRACPKAGAGGRRARDERGHPESGSHVRRLVGARHRAQEAGNTGGRRSGRSSKSGRTIFACCRIFWISASARSICGSRPAAWSWGVISTSMSGSTP